MRVHTQLVHTVAQGTSVRDPTASFINIKIIFK